MSKYRITELLCVVFAILFIVNSIKGEKPTSKTAEELVGELIASVDDEALIKRENEFIREKFSFDLSVFSSISYYSSDDIMNVNEIFVGVFEDEADASVKTVIEEYANDKFTLFNGYAPEASSLLENAKIEIKSNTVFFCVSENADEIYSAFVALL